MIAPVIEIPHCGDIEKDLISNYNLSNLTVLLDFGIPFLHTYCFAIKTTALLALIFDNCLPRNEPGKNKAIWVYERLISAYLLNNGYSLGSLLRASESYAFNINSILSLKESGSIIASNLRGDPEIPHTGYMGCDLSPYEITFFKNIRHVGEHRGEDISGISETNSNLLSALYDVSQSTVNPCTSMPKKQSFLKQLIKKAIIKFRNYLLS